MQYGCYIFPIIFPTLLSSRFLSLLTSPAVSHISYLNSKKVSLDKFEETKSTTEKSIKNQMIKEEKVHHEVVT